MKGKFFKVLVSTLVFVPLSFFSVACSFEENSSASSNNGSDIFVARGGTIVEITPSGQSLTAIEIPSEIDGVSITAIANGAFSDCRNLTSIGIPDSVTSIADMAFYNCTSLTSVHITSIEAWCNITFEDVHSNPLWYAKNLYLNNTLATKLVVPNGVKSIGNLAFTRCVGLTSITIANSVKSIGEGAFGECSGLTSVVVGSRATLPSLHPQNNYCTL